jgi:hypothetical protein
MLPQLGNKSYLTACWLVGWLVGWPLICRPITIFVGFDLKLGITGRCCVATGEINDAQAGPEAVDQSSPVGRHRGTLLERTPRHTMDKLPVVSSVCMRKTAHTCSRRFLRTLKQKQDTHHITNTNHISCSHFVDSHTDPSS